MGIQTEPMEMVLALLPQLPPRFRVVELGDQFITAPGEWSGKLAKGWYEHIGAGKYVSLDANGLNGAIPFDLNRAVRKQDDPPTAELKGGFHLVTDFGTCEHVFNQAQCWQTIHELCRTGGFIAFDHPSQGYEGHGFYRLDWCLIAALMHANDYEPLRLVESETSRGRTIRGIMRKRGDASFVVPQQGRYVKTLAVDVKAQRRGPDHKNQELRAAGVVGLRKPMEQK